MFVICQRSKQGRSYSLGRAPTSTLQGHGFGEGHHCYTWGTQHGMGVMCDAAELSTLKLPAASPLGRGVNPSLPWQEFLSSLLYKHKSKHPDLKARHSLPKL